MEVVCHRGANALAPENTYAAAGPCIDWGADYLEIDINTSKDGVVYLFHGPALARTTNGTGHIYDWSSDELDKLDAGSWFHPDFSDQRMPRLEPFLDWIDGRIKLFFDVKWANLPQLAEVIRCRNLQHDSFFWFGRSKHATELFALAPDLIQKINVTSPAEVGAAVREFGAQIVECNLADDVDGIVSEARRFDVRTMILEKSNDKDKFHQAMASGADMINVDYADVFLECQRDNAGAGNQDTNT